MKKRMFSDLYGLTEAVLDGSKTMTRDTIPLTDADEEYLNKAFDWELRESVILDRYAKYKIDEEVAVAQSYSTLQKNGFVPPEWCDHSCESSAGYNNKMFVKAELMPTRFRVTNRKIERLHSISAEDALREGVKKSWNAGFYFIPNLYTNILDKRLKYPSYFQNPQLAFFYLCKKLRMIINIEANPWMIAYTFELLEGDE